MYFSTDALIEEIEFWEKMLEENSAETESNLYMNITFALELAKYRLSKYAKNDAYIDTN